MTSEATSATDTITPWDGSFGQSREGPSDQRPAGHPRRRTAGGSTTINGEVVRRDPEVERQRRRERIENLEFFYEVPVIRGLGVGWNGTIWVQRRGDEPTSKGPINLLTQDGRYVGSYRTGATEIFDASGPNGLVWRRWR